MITPRREEELLSVARRVNRDGWLVVTCANWLYVGKVLNWLIAVRRLGVENALIVALDQRTHQFLSERGFATVLVPSPNVLRDIWTARLRVARSLLRNGFSIIQSDADAVWLRDPRRDFFETDPASIVASQGTYCPMETYRAWGFVLCAGLISLRADEQVNGLVDRWLVDLEETGSDQKSLNRLLLADGVAWDADGAVRLVRRFRNRAFHSFDRTIRGACSRARVEIRLLPHTLFQRVPVPASEPYVVHYLPDLAARPETQALTASGSWFLADSWRSVRFDASTLDRILRRQEGRASFQGGELQQTVERAEWLRPVVTRVVD